MTNKNITRLFYKACKLAFLALSIGYFIVYTERHLDEVPTINWDSTNILVGLISVFLASISIMIIGFIWQLLLRDQGVVISWKRIQVVVSTSQFGKYLPGNIGQHVGRLFMARREGISAPTSLGTMLIEALWGISVGAALSLMSLLYYSDTLSLATWIDISAAQLIAVLFLAILSPVIIVKFINLFLPRLAENLAGVRKIPEPRPLTSIFVLGLHFLCFLLIGFILKLQTEWFFGVEDISLLKLTSLFAFAWIAGYLVPGAPAGLGIRETLMVLMLSPVIGSGVAVGISISLRLTTTTGDALAFALGLIFGKRFQK